MVETLERLNILSKLKLCLKRRTIKLPRYLKKLFFIDSDVPFTLGQNQKVAIIFVATSSGVMFELFIFVIFLHLEMYFLVHLRGLLIDVL